MKGFVQDIEGLAVKNSAVGRRANLRSITILGRIAIFVVREC
jgi:hypothetical protein